MKLIDSTQTNLLSNAMDAYELRQKAIASNVANIDTPGYKRKEVSFEDQLQKAESTHLKGQDQGIDSVKPQMIQEDQPPQLEDEMMTLADTQMRVQLVTRALRHSFQMIQSSLKSGQQA
jgi:flagellar basal-body rod protein FlgB